MKRVMLPLLSVLFLADIYGENARLKQEAALYQTRCTQCHPIEMAKVTSGKVLPSEVLEMTQRMQQMPGSLIKENEIPILYRFAMFDIYANQRDELKTRLEGLSPEEKQKELAALKEALQNYQ